MLEIKNAKRPSLKEKLRTAQDVVNWVDCYQSVAPGEEGRNRIVNTEDAASLSSCSSESTLVERPQYLNGGYAWFIVGCSFIMHFVADGFTFSFGLVFHKILETYGSQRLGASAVASIFLAAPLILSPIAANITDVMGCSKTARLGAGISFVGSLLSIYAPDIYTFTICFGFLVGVGLALIYNAAIVMVTLYFDVKLALGTSLAVSGTGVGTVVFPKLIGMVESMAGYENSTTSIILMLAAFLFSILMLTIFIDDVEWTSDTIEYKEKWFDRRRRKMDQTVLELRSHGCVEMHKRRAYSLPHGLNVCDPIKTSYLDKKDSVQLIKEEAVCNEGPTRCRSVGTFNRRLLPSVPEYSMINCEDMNHLQHLDLQIAGSPANTIHSKPRTRVLSKTSMSVDAINELEDNQLHQTFFGSESNSETSDSDSEKSNDGDSSSSDLSDRCLNKIEMKEKTDDFCSVTPLTQSARVMDTKVSGRLFRPSLIPSMNSVTPGRVPAGNAIALRTRYQSDMIAFQGKMPSAPDLGHKKQKWHNKYDVTKTAVKIFGNFVESFPVYVELLKQYEFKLFIISTSALYMVLDVPYVFFYDHTVENLRVPSDQAEYLTSTIGVFNFISIWSVGWMADKEFFKKRLFVLYGFCMIAVSSAMYATALATDFKEMIVICSVFGFFISANYVLQNILVTQMWPDDMTRFTYAYACCSFCEGIATLFGPPIIGYIRDTTGTYSIVFYLAGSLVMISAALCFLIHNKFSEQRKLKKNWPGKRTFDGQRLLAEKL